MKITLGPSLDPANTVKKAGSGGAATNDIVACTPDGTAARGTVYGVNAYNSGASPYFIQIHDKTAAVAGADVPYLPAIPIAATGAASVDFGVYGVPFFNGLKVVASTTALTYTAPGATDVAIGVRFESSVS